MKNSQDLFGLSQRRRTIRRALAQLGDTCRRAVRGDRGSMSVFAAVTISAAIAISAFSIDLGNGFVMRSRLQATADASALAGLLELPEDAAILTPGETNAVITAAQNFAVANMGTAANGIVLMPRDILIGFWDATGEFGAARTFYSVGNLPNGAFINAVQTRTRRSDDNGNPLILLFSGILGLTDIGVSAEAIAAYGVNGLGDACIFALKTDERLGVGVIGTAIVDVDCSIVSNSPVRQGGNACLWATNVHSMGTIDGACMYDVVDRDDPISRTYGGYEDDPFCRDPVDLCLGEPDYSGGGGCDETDLIVGPDQSVFLPGNRIYCGDLHIQGTALFGPGLHYISGGKFKVNSGAVVNTGMNDGETIIYAADLDNEGFDRSSYGVTIFLDSQHRNDTIEINGDSQVHLFAPSDPVVFQSNSLVMDNEYLGEGGEGLIGILFYQTREADEGSRHIFNGGSEMLLDGIIYTPRADLQFNGGSDVDFGSMMIISGSVDFIGTTNIDDTPLNSIAIDNPFLDDIRFARLVY